MPRSEHNTLTANTVTTIELSADQIGSIAVTNRSGANPIFFRIDRTNPTIEGDDSYVVTSGAGTAKVLSELGGINMVEVRLISAGAEDYSVEVD